VLVAEMLNEIVTRAAVALSRADEVTGSRAAHHRGHRRNDDARMGAVGKLVLGVHPSTVVDLIDEY
jgi:hypothetical protein